MIDPSELDTAEFPLPQTAERVRPSSSLVRVDVAAQSDKGKKRDTNQDHFTTLINIVLHVPDWKT